MRERAQEGVIECAQVLHDLQGRDTKPTTVLMAVPFLSFPFHVQYSR